MADSKKNEDEVSLADIDPFFKQALEEKAAAEKAAAEGKPKKDAKPKVEISDADRALYDLLGAYGGSKAARVLETGVRVLPETAAAPLREMGFPTAGAGTRAAPRAPAAPVAPAPMTAPVAGGPAGPVGGPASVIRQPTQLGVPGTYPTATGPGSATFNYGRVYGLPEIEATKALGTGSAEGEVWDLLNKRREGLGRVQQMGGGFIENPRFGGLLTPEQGVGGGPRASFAHQPAIPPSPDVPGGRPAGLSQLPPRQAVPTQAARPGALTNAFNVGKGIVKTAAGSPFVTGALGGLGAVEGAQEFYKRQQEGDVVGQALAGMGAAGGLASLAPHPLAKLIGGGLSAASPLTLYLYDKIKNRPQPPLQPRIPEPGTNIPPSEFAR